MKNFRSNKLIMIFLWKIKSLIRIFLFFFNFIGLQKKVFIQNKEIIFEVLSGDTRDQILNSDESEIYEYLSKFPPNHNLIFYDLGASIGNFSIFASACGFTVFSFEPDKENFIALEKNIINYKNINIFKYIIGDGCHKKMILQKNSYKNNSGDHNKVVKLNYQYGDPLIYLNLDISESVDAISLDQFVFVLNNPIPSILKIDIDGSEYEFIKGAQKVLNHILCKHIIIELYKDNNIYLKIMKNLRSHKFKLYKEFPITHHGRLQKNLVNMFFIKT